MRMKGFMALGEELKKPLHYTACGLDDVYLLNGYEIHKTDYGQGISVKHADDLHLEIGLALVKSKKGLTGKELRYLRKQMDITQSELGRLVGMSAQQVARWEKGISEIPGPADRLLRMLFAEYADKGDVEVRELLEFLDTLDDIGSPQHLFETTDDGWRAAAA